MPNKKINQLTPRTPTLTDLILVGDPATGYSYKATLSAMINFVGGNIQFSSLGGISLTNPTNGQVLTFNGTNWVNQTPAAAPVSSVFGRTGAVVAAEGDYSLTQLSDVTISSPTNGQVLKYNGTAWVNGSDTDTGIISLNGLTATTQTFATGTSGTDFNISSATSTHTFNLPTASATNRGALSSSDWSTFNAKQNTITLATIGNSGAATFISNTLNIPNYTLVGLGGITLNSLAASSPLSYDSITGIFSIQIANSTQNGYLSSLSFNTFTNKQNAITLTTTGSNGSATFISDTLNIPTYTLAGLGGISLSSLSASAPLSYNSGTGAFSITQASGSTNGFLSSTDWTTFNNKQSTITLTTTGSSGAATFVSNTLNIPNYTLAGLGGVSGSGTTNYVPKWTSSTALGNSLISDNSTLGNVGINTASPASTLEIYKSTGANYLYVTNGTSGTLNGVVLRYNSVDYMGMIGNFNSGEFKVGGFNASGYFMTFYSNNAERMRLTPSGRLLLGTSTESTFLLDVNGTARVTADTYLATNAIANLVGIGTTSPTHKLDIVRNDASTTPIVSISNNTAQSTSRSIIRFAPNTATGQIGTVASTWTIDANINANETYLYGSHGILLYNASSTAPTRFFTNTSERMRLTAAGRLLLGTTTESTYLLDINGTARVSGTELRLDNGTTGTLNIYSNTPSIQFFSADPTGYRIFRSGTTMTWNSANIALHIAGNSGYTLDAANGHIWRTALSGGAALARLTTGGSLSIGNANNAANASSILDLTSTTKGFLPPRMTTTQKNAISSPAAGLVVYDTTLSKLCVYTTAWETVTSL
jgi:hypothetical protein